MTNARQKLGRWGEDLAARFLTERGYTILEQNARNPYGEIDLVAQKGGTTTFVEVKTRTSKLFGYPEEAITPKKQEHLLASALHYLQTHPELGEDWQIDVVAIRKWRNEPPEIVHFENCVNA